MSRPVERPDLGDRALLPTATRAQTRREVRAILGRHRGVLALSVLTLLVGTVLGLVVPRTLGAMVDLVVRHLPPGGLFGLAAVLLAASVGQAVFVTVGGALTARLGQTALASVRERVVGVALRLPTPEVERAGTGDLVARVSGDVESVGEAVTGVLPTLVEASFTIVLTLVALIVLDWRFALAGLLAVPLQLIALRWYLRTVAPVTRSERVAEGARAQQLLESIGGADTVRAFRRGEDHVALVAARSAEAKTLSIRLAALQRRFFGKLNYGELTGLLALTAVGYLLVGRGTATVGAAAAAALYFHRLFDPFNQLLGLFDQAQTAGAAFARLVGVAAAPLPDPPEEGEVPAPAEVNVHDVWFRYSPDGPDVLDGVSLRVPEGRRLAVVGTTGAGKTTLAGVIAGVHRPSAGRVRLGATPVDALGPATLRRTCSLITQETHVFAGPLAEDLRLVAPEADDATLEAALRRVGAWEWVHALPEGLATRVGSGGAALSAAQAQELALARLVLADPPVAVLDEATAEAGSARARSLEDAAERALAGRTAVVVAHRLTQAARADEIVVLDRGRVVERGSHPELVAAGGAYARLWSAWASSRNDGDPAESGR